MPHLRSPNVGKIPDFKPQRMREIRIFGYAIVTLSDTEVLFLLDLKTIGFFDIKQFYPMVKRLYELGLLEEKKPLSELLGRHRMFITHKGIEAARAALEPDCYKFVLPQSKK